MQIQGDTTPSPTGGMRNRPEQRIGHLVGTPYFMSPEQCQGDCRLTREVMFIHWERPITACCYSLLTGIYPFQDTGSVVQVMFANCNAAPPDPREVRASVPSASEDCLSYLGNFAEDAMSELY